MTGASTQTPLRVGRKAFVVEMVAWKAAWRGLRRPIRGCKFLNFGFAIPRSVTRVLTSGRAPTVTPPRRGVMVLSGWMPS